MSTPPSNMLTTDPPANVRRELQSIERDIADATQALHRLEGQRDKLLARLLDLEGAHDRRFVPVR